MNKYIFLIATLFYTLYAGNCAFPQTNSIWENPPFYLINKALNDTDNINFSSEYGITRNNFLNLLITNSNKYFNDEDINNGIIFIHDSKKYFIDTSYSYDLLGLFRKRPGDAGWNPKVILFNCYPGEEKKTLKYIRENGYKVKAIDSNYAKKFHINTTKDKLISRAIKEGWYSFSSSYDNNGENKLDYYWRAIEVESMQEEECIKKLRKTGLFLFLSRDALEAGSYYSTLVLKRKTIYGVNNPNRQQSIKFFNDFFESKAPSKITVETIPLDDFSYSITFYGASKYLSLKMDNLWEKFSFNIFLQNGFNCKPDEMEIMWQYVSVDFAKGSEDRMPPLERFGQTKDEERDFHKATSENYAQKLFNDFADKCKGSIK